MKVIPDDNHNEPMWIRLALTRDQISNLNGGPVCFNGTADIQYVSKHDIGNRSNVEIRIKELSIGPYQEYSK